MSSTKTSAATTARVQRDAHLRWVPIASMKVNPLAQREINPAWVDHIVANLDLEDLGTPTVNLRDGHYYIIDGQHRIAALKAMGWGDQQIQCWTYEGMTEQEEAERFLKLNNVRVVPAMPKFKVSVAAERSRESDIDRIVRAAGLVVTHDKVPGAIGAVGTLARVYDRSGPKTLGRSLRIIRDAFGDAGFEAAVIDGIGHLCQRYNGQLEDDVAVQRLGAMHGGVKGLLNKAAVIRQQTGGTRGDSVAAAAVETYNRGRGGKKLPGWFKGGES